MGITPDTWQAALKGLKGQVPGSEFAAIFQVTQFDAENSNGRVRLTVPSEWHRERLQVRLGLIQSILASLDGGHVPEIEISIKVPSAAEAEQLLNQAAEVDEARLQAASGQRHLKLPSPKSIGLDPRRTPEKYVVGGHNQSIWQCLLAVAEVPGQVEGANPVYIWGESGVGKTCLAQTIANLARHHHPELSIIYVSAATFRDDYTRQHRLKGETEQLQARADFRRKYSNLGLAVIDEIDLLVSSPKTQEQLCLFLKFWLEKGVQVIFISAKAPEESVTLEPLVTRLKGGYCRQLEPPDRDTRFALVDLLARERGVAVSADVRSFLVDGHQDMRSLEGAIKTLLLEVTRGGNPQACWSLSVAARILGQRDRSQPPTPEKIIEVVAAHFHLDEEDLSGRRKTKQLTSARWLAWRLMDELVPGITRVEMGKALKKDHTSVVHGLAQLELVIRQKPEMNGLIEQLKRKI